MNKTTKELLKELIVEVSRYFTKEEVEHYKQILEEAEEKYVNLEGIDEMSKDQLESYFGSGSDIRDQVDKIITYSDDQLSDNDRLKLLVSISSLMINYGEMELALDLAEEVEKKAKSANFEHLLAEAYLLQSKVYCNQNEWNETKRFCKKALYMFTEIGDELGMANSENVYGAIALEKGELKEAKSHFLSASDLAESLDADLLKAALNSNIGIINDIQGNLEAALEHYSAAETNLVKLNDPRSLARLHHNMGMLYSKKMDYEKALDYFNKSIDVSIKKGYLSNCAISFIGKANIYAKTGKPDLSEAFVNKAVEISIKLNDRLSIADAYRIKGVINKNLDNHQLSEEYFENSLRLNDDFNNEANIAETSIEMSELYEDMDEEKKAETLKSKGELYYERMNEN